jgi:hypothetical protein
MRIQELKKLCLDCGTAIDTVAKRCHSCKRIRFNERRKKRRKDQNKTCLCCDTIVSNTSTYCHIHGNKLRPPGNGHKIHQAKIRNGSYYPIGREYTGKDGYVYIKVSSENDSDYGNYIVKHRYVMGQALGRKLERQEHVHHIDGDKTNNDLSNLLLLTGIQHNKLNHFLALLNELPLDQQQKLILTIKLRYPNLFNN